MPTAKTTTENREHRNSPVYWFVVLDDAREQRDYERAAEAIRELRRLGVVVRFSARGASR
jgi:hypothetical protein